MHPAGPSPTCVYCSSLTTGSPSIYDIDKGRAEGCIYCTVVSTFFDQVEVTAASNGNTFVRWIPGVEFRLELQGHYSWCLSWCLYALDDQMLPWLQFPIKTEATLVDFDPSSESSFQFLNNELSDCLANHPKCRVGEPYTPTRLLRLVNGSKFRIVELPKTDIVSYIALSYCWGTDQALKLVSTNKKQLEQGLSISILPVVFRDTVEVARKLGIFYLWIDSLCILQDSDSDWRVESAAMPQIYRSAYLTVAASSSLSTIDSYLNRDPIKTPDFAKPLVPENKTSRHQWPLPSDHPDPLIQRGWTLQERLLSARVISFSTGELEWLCGTVTKCECTAGTATNGWNNHSLNISAQAIDSREQALLFWCAQLSIYSNLTFTYGHDKLPAIGGLARALAPTIGSKYLAGVWEDDLARGLAWLRVVNLTNSPPWIASYCAPSWSWAAVDGKFMYFKIQGHHVSLLKSCECATVPKDSDPYSEICDGQIKVHAALFRVVLYYDYGVRWRVEHPRPVPDFAHMLEIHVDGMFDTRSVSSLLECDGSMVVRSNEAYDEQELISRLRVAPHAFVLPLAYIPHTSPPRGVSTIDGTYTMLVLAESLAKPGCFERIGFSSMIGTNRQPTEGTGLVRDFFNELDTSIPWSDDDYTMVTII